MYLMMAGLDYGRAPITLREQLSFTKGQVGTLDARIRDGVRGVEGCVLISTCNRTELYLSCAAEDCPDPAALLCAAAGVAYAPFRAAFVTRRGDAVVRHLMEVAGGLRSQIWGEDQIITQVKNAIAIARARSAADAVLETLFGRAVAAGKEIKTKVRLQGQSASAAARAVEVLAARAGGLCGKRALVIGNGEMGRLAAAQLRDMGCTVTVTLRTYRHGETVVPAGCAVVPYERRYAAMAETDLLISATTSPHYTVALDELSQLAQVPPLMADLAIPRDIQPEVGALPGVTLYNVDTLGGGAARSIPPEVEALLGEQMERFHQWENYRESLPLLEQVKEAITRRVITTTSPDALDALDPSALVELAVGRAVDLLAGGLRDGLSADRLRRCNEIIRAHTRAGSAPAACHAQEEEQDERIPLSAVR